MDMDAVRRGAEAPVVADRAGVDLAAADLSEAFVRDPRFMRPDKRRDPARAAFFRHVLRSIAAPTGTIERPAAGGAAAVWIPSERLGPNPPHKEIAALPVLLAASGLRRFSRLIQLRKAMDANHPSEPHDYLWFLGVHPAAQGAGVGSRLIASRTARLDADRRAAFLETATPRNVTLYNRHGFEITGEYRPAPDAPLVWAMWRAPRVG